MEFADWLESELARRGWTKAEFARRSGVHHGTVSRWLSGERRPDAYSTMQIANGLGIAPNVVLERAGHYLEQLKGVDETEKKLESLRAELETLRGQSLRINEARQRVRQQIGLLESRWASSLPTSWRVGIDHVRAKVAAAAWSQLSTEQVPSIWPELGTEESRKQLLGTLDRLFAVEDQVSEQFLSDFRDEWTDRERDAFAAGLRLGMRLGDFTDPRQWHISQPTSSRTQENESRDENNASSQTGDYDVCS